MERAAHLQTADHGNKELHDAIRQMARPKLGMQNDPGRGSRLTCACESECVQSGRRSEQVPVAGQQRQWWGWHA